MDWEEDGWWMSRVERLSRFTSEPMRDLVGGSTTSFARRLPPWQK